MLTVMFFYKKKIKKIGQRHSREGAGAASTLCSSATLYVALIVQYDASIMHRVVYLIVAEPNFPLLLLKVTHCYNSIFLHTGYTYSI
jgi:hypothetical protein